MGFNIKQILLKFDFVGPIPEFRILNQTRYTSIFSSILSLLLIIFSIGFVIYSFNEYLKQNPKVEYYKNNDFSTNKTFVISDSLLMFNYDLFCFDDMDIKHIKPTARIYLNNDRTITDFTLEPCELGKNINSKHKEVIEKFEALENTKLKDYYCVNYNGSDVALYSHPSLTYYHKPSLIFKISAVCEDYTLIFNLVTENDFIDHNKKDNPIVPYYQKNKIVLDNEQKYAVYNYQYIKYESDNGFLFNDKIIFNGIGISASNLFDKFDISNNIVNIEFKMNDANYDFYRRTFIKFQSFLAEVMSLINLLITISKVVTEFLLYKKMHKDIIKYIITNKKKEIIQPNKIKKVFDINNINDTKIEKLENLENKISQNKIIEEKVNGVYSKVSLDTLNKNDDLKFENDDKIIIKIMKRLNFINIIKSFFCNKDKKLKLINICNDVINKDICAERILRRLYILENEYNSLIEEDTSKPFIDNDISKIKKIIKGINKIEANNQKIK